MKQRTIKFRVWAKNDGGFFLKGDEFEFIQGKGYFAPHGISPETVVVQQFTSLYDKNGREIYEGDILVVYPDNTQKELLEDTTTPVYLLRHDLPRLPQKDVVLMKGVVEYSAPAFILRNETNTGSANLFSCDQHCYEI